MMGEKTMMYQLCTTVSLLSRDGKVLKVSSLLHDTTNYHKILHSSCNIQCAEAPNLEWILQKLLHSFTKLIVGELTVSYHRNADGVIIIPSQIN
jgi:hypothetical protein